MKIVDTKGQLCPAPLIMTKRALREATDGEVIEILTDDDTACSNLMNYLKELTIVPVVTRDGNVSILRITKAGHMEGEVVDESVGCSVPRSGYVVVIKSLMMGSGDDELGVILLRAFINSLLEAEALPTTIVLYNEGIRVALRGSDTAATLCEMEQRGVSVLVCGTCADYYGVKEQLTVGMISNMYTITKVLGRAGHVIYP